MLMLSAALLVVLQQELSATPASSTPVHGDTTGYWQQRIAYRIVATLDEPAQRVRAQGTLHYVNNSPDTLREMYVHQYLNAFRPLSKWSRADEREGRERFQHLREPDYGYERFTAPVRVNGATVAVDYPGAPDSTVAHFRLPSPLAPHDSLDVDFAWDARPSTIPRRQARRSRTWDLAQWYPKVAVYDRGGWEPNALRPAGELYGEYGTYDVTLIVRQDQVIGATGVPVEGDPGWSGARRAGIVRPASNAYGAEHSATDGAPGSDMKAVRFVARDVHHFAWSASPDYRYEGGVYVRPVPRVHWPTWDTVSIHVLYKPADDTTWGHLRVVQRTINALRWLEAIYGPYAYPQMTVLHRLDAGGTEFPMMQMNGSPSPGLILHEGGHVFTYGILGNNEWRSGWMDEGLTSYQTDWAQLLTTPERARRGIVDALAPVPGYRAHAMRMLVPRGEETGFSEAMTDIQGDAQPLGTIAHEFRDFSTYNEMIYDRANVMYGQLRDVLGDSLFVEFLHDYYARWALKHVDERAMRASAERVSGRNLGWFFEQWVHRVGLTDYALRKARTTRGAAGEWTTDAHVVRVGGYRHAIAVGVRTASGWTIGRADPALDRQHLRIATREEPLEVRLDPLHFSWDWNRRNDIPRSFFGGSHRSRVNFDWPFLDQADRERNVVLLSSLAWYSRPGGFTPAVRVRGNYLGSIDRSDIGAAWVTRRRLDDPHERLQLWERLKNPYFRGRPLIGLHADVGILDDIFSTDIGWRRERSWARFQRTYDVALTMARAARGPLVPEFWSDSMIVDIGARAKWTVAQRGGSYLFAAPGILVGVGDRSYAKAELSLGAVRTISDNARAAVRLYGGAAQHVPQQRALFVSTADPVSTFYNHWWRPQGSILKRDDVNWLPLGGAALRGYSWTVTTRNVVATNVDLSRRIMPSFGTPTLALWAHAFGDAARADSASPPDWLADAGVGLSVRGRLYDRDVIVRIDAPFYVSRPELAIGPRRQTVSAVRGRWLITFNDLF